MSSSGLHWAPRLGATYQVDEKTVVRAGYARSYDIGVFGTTFGGTVTQTLPVLAVQELNPAANHDAVFNLAQGPPPARLPTVPASGRFPLPDGVATVAHRRKMRLPAVDAWNLALQRQLTDTTSLELAYVANRGTHSNLADNVTVDANQPTLAGFAEGVPRDLRRPYFAGPVAGFGAAYGWTQRIDYYCNLRDLLDPVGIRCMRGNWLLRLRDDFAGCGKHQSAAGMAALIQREEIRFSGSRHAAATNTLWPEIYPERPKA